MITVFKCVFPDGKIYIGKTKRSLKEYVLWIGKKSMKPNNVFLWALSKHRLSDIKWIEVGSYWSSSSANEVYENLIKNLKTYDREFGYNYLKESKEKAALSRIKSRFKKLLDQVENKKLKAKIESTMRDIDTYLKK